MHATTRSNSCEVSLASYRPSYEQRQRYGDDEPQHRGAHRVDRAARGNPLRQRPKA